MEVREIPPICPPKRSKEKVAAYCRVSTTHDEQLHSMEAQVEHYTNMIKERTDWDFAGVYHDTKTGRNITNRPCFRQMLSDCREGKITLILTKTMSRFCRNTVDMLIILKELHELKVHILFENENINTKDFQSEVILTMYAAFAQAESENRSRDINWGIRHAMKNGSSSYISRICYGYTKDEERHLVIQKEQAEIVRKIFQMYLEGSSLSAIAKNLEIINIPGIKGGKKWSSQTINNLVANEKYIGDVVLQKTFIDNFFDPKQLKNKGQKDKYYVHKTHEGIISSQIFDMVSQERMKRTNLMLNRRGKAKRKSTRYSSTNSLSGLVQCNECKRNYRRITRYTKTGRWIVWICANRVEHGRKICKYSPTISEAAITQSITDALKLPEYDEKLVRIVVDRIVVSQDSGLKIELKILKKTDI